MDGASGPPMRPPAPAGLAPLSSACQASSSFRNAGVRQIAYGRMKLGAMCMRVLWRISSWGL